MTDPITVLRETISEWAGDDETDPAFATEWTAFTQVENLVQAAKNWYTVVGDYWPYPSEGANAQLRDALAPFKDTP